MANLTKIIIGLNIAAGIAGLLFGLSVIPGKVDTLSKSKAEEEKKAANAIEKLTKAEAALSGAGTTTNKLTAAEADVRKLEKEKGDALGEAAVSKTEKEQAEKEKKEAEAKVFGLNNQVTTLEDEKRKWGTERIGLKKEIADLEKDVIRLTPKGPPTTPAPTVNAGENVGKIANVDPNNGSLVLNRGSAHEIKVGDLFNVFRNNKLVGRIVVTRLSTNNVGLSIAQRTEGLGVPVGAQFQVNDDFVKFQP